jgi:hypothetical protein
LQNYLQLADKRQGTTLQAAEKLFGLMTVTAFHRDLVYQTSMRGNDQKQEAMFSYLTLA